MQRGMVSSGVAADTKGLLSSGKLQLRIITLYILQCIWVELTMCLNVCKMIRQNKHTNTASDQIRVFFCCIYA